MIWQLQEAKNKFSEVVEKAQTQGPQTISRRGKNMAIVISYEDFQRGVRPKKDLKQVFKEFRGLDFPEVERDKSPTGRATPFTLDEDLE